MSDALAQQHCTGAPSADPAIIAQGIPYRMARSASVLIDLGIGSQRAVRLVQNGIDARWAIVTDVVARARVVDVPTGGIGSEIAVLPGAGPAQLCVWSEDSENSAGTIRIEIIPLENEAVEEAIASRAKADSALSASASERRAAYEASAGRLNRAGFPGLAGEAWLAAGLLAKRDDAPRPAEQDLMHALDLFARSGERELAGWARYSLGSVRSALGRFDDARTVFLEALEQGDGQSALLRGSLQNYVGLMFHAQGRLHEAAQWYEQALATLKSAESPLKKAMITNNLGGLRVQQGREDLAAVLFDDAVSGYEALGNRDFIIEGLTNAGRSYVHMGMFDTARERLDEAIRLRPSPGYAQAGVLGALGEAYWGMGDFRRALEEISGALAQAEKTQDVTMRAGLQNRIGRLALAMGEPSRAVGPLRDAMQAFAGAGDIAGETLAGCELVRVQAALASWSDATSLLDLLQSHVQALEAEELRPQRGCLQLAQGELAAHDGNDAQMRASLDAAEQLFDETGDDARLLETLLTRATISLARGQVDEALAVLAKADVLARRALDSLAAGEQKRTYMDANRRLVDLRVRSLVLRDADAAQVEAFAASAAGRGRLLQTVFVSGGSSARSDDGAERRQLTGLLHRKAELLRTGGSPELMAPLLLEIAAAQDAVRAGDHVGPDLEPIVPFEQWQHQLADNDLLLYYHLGDGWGYLWAVDRDAVSAYPLPGEDTIAPLAEAVRLKWGSAGSSGGADEESTLAHWILDPVLERVSGKRLLVVPDRSLHLVPFAALPLSLSGARVRLIELASIVRLPWPSSIATPTPRELDRAIVVTSSSGATELPATTREIAAIRAALGNDAVEVRTADAESLPEIVRQPAAILHIAVHGYADPSEPGLSSLLFGDGDDAVDVRANASALEIAAWPLRQRLVFLSACETGVGPVSAAEGPVSLAQAFLEARAREVIATLWRVPDVAAARFSGAFYVALAADTRRDPVDAVRAAQLSMLRGTGWRDPYFWAGFALTSAPAGAAAAGQLAREEAITRQ